MKALKSLIAVATFALAAAAQAAPEAYVVDRAHSDTTFEVRHLMSKVRGRFDDFSSTISFDKANPAASSVEFTINATSINTSMPDRDKHLRTEDFFFVEKYPTITFKSTSIKPSKQKDTYDVTGDFTMRGVTKRITIPVTYLGAVKDPFGNEKIGFELTTTLNRKDYGVNWNKALDNGGVLVSDEVTIDINLEAKKASK